MPVSAAGASVMRFSCVNMTTVGLDVLGEREFALGHAAGDLHVDEALAHAVAGDEFLLELLSTRLRNRG